VSRATISCARAVWHGLRRYPADLQRDAADWQRYFASAFVYEIGTLPRSWRMLPPFRYWTGPAHYYFGRQQTVFPRVHDRIYFAVTVWMPIFCLAAGLVACVLILRDWRAARPSSEGV
jgi:hypothetical protein